MGGFLENQITPTNLVGIYGSCGFELKKGLVCLGEEPN
jgi:hypothetical protein